MSESDSLEGTTAEIAIASLNTTSRIAQVAGVRGKDAATSTAENPYRDYTWMQLHDCLTEKEYQLECMGDSVQRLVVLETEEKRKNELISVLRRELAAYKKNSRHKDFSYVSLEEHLASCECHLQEKSREAEHFHHELEEVKGQLQTATQAKSALQQQLSSKLTTLASQTAEIKGLQRQKREAEEEAVALRRSAKERQTKISSLQDSVRRLRTSCQETQTRLGASETELRRGQEREEKTRAELDKLKGQHRGTIIAQLQARQGVLEQELDKTRRRESTLSSELSSMCEQVLRLAECESSSTQTSSSSASAVAAVSSLAEQLTRSREQTESLAGQLEEEQEHLTKVSSTLNELTQSLEEFKGSCEGGDTGVVCSCLQSLLSSVQKLNCNESLTHSLKDILQESVGLVHSALSELTAQWTQLVQQLSESCTTLDDCKGKEEPLQKLSCLVSSHQSLLVQTQELQERLATKEVEHGAALSGAASAYRQESQHRIDEAVERARHEEKEHHQREVQGVRAEMEGERETAIAEERRNTEAVRRDLASTQQLLAERESELEQKKTLEPQLAELQVMLGSLEQSKTEALCVAEEQAATLRQHMQSEVESYKEQSQQYAITIAAMEEKLLALVQKQQLLQRENDSLKQPPDPRPARETKTDKEEEEEEEEQNKHEKLEQLVSILRHQLALSNRECEQLQTKVQELRKELGEKQCAADQLKAQHTAELEDLKKTLSEQEGTLEGQRQEVCRLRGEVEESGTQLATLRQEQRGREEEMSDEMKEQLEAAKKELMESGGRLLELGQRCLGERHSHVLARQRDSLTQLRKRLQETEEGQQPVASHEATLAELGRVREELIEERAQRHLEAEGGGSNTETTLESEPDPVIDALECSEDSYQCLVGRVCEGGFMRRPDNKRMPVSTSQGDRHTLVEERRKFAVKVAKKIKLSASDGTKAKSEARPLYHRESDDGNAEADTKETIARLKTELETTNEELEQQKRLNLALVKRKEFCEQQVAKADALRKSPRHHSSLNTQ